MSKRNRDHGQEGFTLIEVVVSTALLVIAATGFLMMAGTNAGLLAKEHRLDQSNYRIGSMAEEGKGETTGESLTVKFSMEDGSCCPGQEAWEVFDQYMVRDQGSSQEEQGESTGNFIMVYRHR